MLKGSSNLRVVRRTSDEKRDRLERTVPVSLMICFSNYERESAPYDEDALVNLTCSVTQGMLSDEFVDGSLFRRPVWRVVLVEGLHVSCGKSKECSVGSVMDIGMCCARGMTLQATSSWINVTSNASCCHPPRTNTAKMEAQRIREGVKLMAEGDKA